MTLLGIAWQNGADPSNSTSSATIDNLAPRGIWLCRIGNLLVKSGVTMCFDLTVSRDGRFIELTEEFSTTAFGDGDSPMSRWADANDKSDEFRFKITSLRKEYLQSISKELVETDAYAEAFEAFNKQFDINLVSSENRDLNGSVIRPLSEDQIENTHTRFAAVLPGKFAVYRSNNRSWNLNIRASFTSAALEEKGSSSKLWWNFSLAPLQTQDVSEEHIASALKKIERAAELAHPHLRNAFVEAASIVQPAGSFSVASWKDRLGRLIVNFTEHDKASLNEFLKYELFGVSSNGQGTDSTEYKAGKVQLENFVKSLGIKDFRPENILPATGAPDTVGVAYRHVDKDACDIKLTGFSRRPNGGNPLLRNRLSSGDDMNLANRRLHIHSAARAVSAFVTNQHASLIR